MSKLIQRHAATCRIHHFEALDSTNQLVKQFTSKNRPNGPFAISADYQRRGRGQIGRKWESVSGKNVLMSLFKEFSGISASDLFYINMQVALSLRKVLQSHLSQKVYIKWPNDIIVTDKKLVGILIENSLSSLPFRVQSTIGFGINVNQESFDQLNQATSMFLVSGQQVNTSKLRQELITTLMEDLSTIHPNTILENYNENLYRRNEDVEFVDLELNETFVGKIEGVRKDGRLMLRRNNMLKAYAFNTIKMIYPK